MLRRRDHSVTQCVSPKASMLRLFRLFCACSRSVAHRQFAGSVLLAAIVAQVVLAARIPAAVVHAVDRETRRRAEAHIVEKCLRRRIPSSAHVDTATAIVGVLTILLVLASVTHLLPCAVGGGAGLAVSSCRGRVSGRVPAMAPARLCLAADEGITAHSLLDAALAPNPPVDPLLLGAIKAKDGEFCERLAGEIDALRTRRIDSRHAPIVRTFGAVSTAVPGDPRPRFFKRRATDHRADVLPL